VWSSGQAGTGQAVNDEVASPNMINNADYCELRSGVDPVVYSQLQGGDTGNNTVAPSAALYENAAR